MRRWRFALAALLTVMLAGAAFILWIVYPYFLPNDFSPAALELTSKRAEPIIAALEAYKSKAGEYPETLQEAKIDLLAFEPPVAGSQRWGYRLMRPGEYRLGVGARIKPGSRGGITGYTFYSEREKWIVQRVQPLWPY
jgi:hypothetical protein